MQLEHTFTVPVGIDDAWKVLLDIERVAPCMPGAALETVDGDDFTGSVKVKLGPISLTYKGKASFVEKDEAAHRAKIDAQGRDSRGNGTAGAIVTATLTADGASSTRVDVLTDLNITGKPAQFGRGVMVDVGNKLIGQFADALSAQLGEGSSASTEAAAPSAPAKAAATKAAPAKAAPAKTTAAAAKAPAKAAATKTTPAAPATPQPSEAERAAEEPAGLAEAAIEDEPVTEPVATSEPAVASEPAAVASPAPRTIAAREVEPIDLMASAGPAVVKRVAPIAAAAVVVLAIVAVVIRRRRS